MWARRLRAAIHRFSAHAARSLEALLLRTQINAFTNICVMTLMFMRHLSGPTRSRWLSAVAAGRERGGNIPSFQYLVREGAASRRDKKRAFTLPATCVFTSCCLGQHRPRFWIRRRNQMWNDSLWFARNPIWDSRLYDRRPAFCASQGFHLQINPPVLKILQAWFLFY